MKVLITGAAGHLGKHVAAFLSAEAHELAYLVRRTVADLPAGEVFNADLQDSKELRRIFETQKPEAVVHLAAMVGSECESNPEVAFAVNVNATENLAKLAVEFGVRYFVFASTGAVYAQNKLRAVQEGDLVQPSTVYAKTKLEAERSLKEIAKNSVTKVVAFRIFNIYGPEFTNSLIYRLLHSTFQNPVELLGGDTFCRDYVFAGDVAQALTNFESFGKLEDFTVCNIGSGVARSNDDVVADLKAKGHKIFYEIRSGKPSYSWADISFARKKIGFKPTTDLIT